MSAPVRIMILALALVGTALPLAAQTPPEPIVKVEGLRQISAHVHIIPDNSVPLVPNIGYVVGDPALIARLERAQPPWPISAPAIAAMVATSSADALAEELRAAARL